MVNHLHPMIERSRIPIDVTAINGDITISQDKNGQKVNFKTNSANVELNSAIVARLNNLLFFVSEFIVVMFWHGDRIRTGICQSFRIMHRACF